MSLDPVRVMILVILLLLTYVVVNTLSTSYPVAVYRIFTLTNIGFFAYTPTPSTLRYVVIFAVLHRYIPKTMFGIAIIIVVCNVHEYITNREEAPNPRRNKAFMKISYKDKIKEIEDIVIHPHLGVKGDLLASAEALARLRNTNYDLRARPEIGILAGPDNLADAVTLSVACMHLGYNVAIISEKCNEPILKAAYEGIKIRHYCPNPMNATDQYSSIKHYYISRKDKDKRMSNLEKGMKEEIDMIIACDRAGPSADGYCYTVRGTKLNDKRFIAPLHNSVKHFRHRTNDMRKFIAIGDGGNELGFGKVIDKVHKHINNGKRIGAVANSNGKDIAADHIIAAADVSTLGVYALIAATALVRAHDSDAFQCVTRVMPTEASQRALWDRCIAEGKEAASRTSEERLLKCLNTILKVAMRYE